MLNSGNKGVHRLCILPAAYALFCLTHSKEALCCRSQNHSKKLKQQRANTILTLLVLIHILSACSKPSEPGMASVQVKELGAQSTNRYLAYQHQVGLEVEVERILD